MDTAPGQKRKLKRASISIALLASATVEAQLSVNEPS